MRRNGLQQASPHYRLSKRDEPVLFSQNASGGQQETNGRNTTSKYTLIPSHGLMTDPRDEYVAQAGYREQTTSQCEGIHISFHTVPDSHPGEEGRVSPGDHRSIWGRKASPASLDFIAPPGQYLTLTIPAYSVLGGCAWMSTGTPQYPVRWLPHSSRTN